MPRKTERNQWKPASRLATFEKKEGYHYRFLNADPDNIERRKLEGYELVNKTTGIPGEFTEEQDPISGAKKHRELVLAATPEENFKAREGYYQELADRQTAALKQNLQQQMAEGGDAKAEGKIVIE